MSKIVILLFSLLVIGSLISLKQAESNFSICFSLYSLGLGTSILLGALFKLVQKEAKYLPSRKNPHSVVCANKQ
jgi:hypothetical protein